MMVKTANRARLAGLVVTTALATATLAGCTGKVAPTAEMSAAKANTALAKGKGEKAVSYAEAAVLASPRNAGARALLGAAYIEAGRFRSAATTLGEAVELGDTSQRTIVTYALSQVAAGDPNGALSTLDTYEAALDPADYGLAVALAGRPQQGVHVLSNALRNGQNTVKVRQNLAYAFALTGDWRSARLMASQDLPGNKVGERLGEWAQLSSPAYYRRRVADLLGVAIAEDPGQPATLALANHPSVDMLAAEAATQEVAQPEETPRIVLADPAPTASRPALDLPEPEIKAEAKPVVVATLRADEARFKIKEVAQHVPSTAPRIAKANPKAEAAPVHLSPDGKYRVQLGSYFTMADAHEAWKLFQRRHPELKGASQVFSKAEVRGKTYYRVAAAGFDRIGANAMCSKVKQGGGGCIAYAADRPLPGTIDNDIRVASR